MECAIAYAFDENCVGFSGRLFFGCNGRNKFTGSKEGGAL